MHEFCNSAQQMDKRARMQAADFPMHCSESAFDCINLTFVGGELIAPMDGPRLCPAGELSVMFGSNGSVAMGMQQILHPTAHLQHLIVGQPHSGIH